MCTLILNPLIRQPLGGICKGISWKAYLNFFGDFPHDSLLLEFFVHKAFMADF